MHVSPNDGLNTEHGMQAHTEKRDVHAQPQGLTDHLPAVGYLRQSQLIPAILPFSGSTLWRKVNAGEFPKPVKLSARVTAWRVEDVRNWMAKIDEGSYHEVAHA